ncbi:MAG TPA: hypothetical protein VKW04_16865 [Planctomycetota bacterium]|nr:hypothetical protein [Planctomycetota bacterium]
MFLAVSLALVLAAQAGQEPPVTTGADQGSALRFQLSGHLDLHYLDRSPAIEDAGAQLNQLAPGTTGSSTQWSGRISLRADVEVKDLVSGVIELENRSFENGINKPFGASPPDTPMEIKQGYIEIGQFLTSELDVRIGVQNVTFRNRPQDEPFFMDLGESEPFSRGFHPVGSFVSNSVDRDIGQAVGIRAFYSPIEVATIQAFWMVYQEKGGTSQDEAVYGLVANTLVAENWSVWLLATAVKDGGDRMGTIGTLGAGMDGYLGESKDLELFTEVYGQAGTLQHAPAAVHKEAYAFNAGARWLGCCDHKVWFEAAVSRRSGDRHAGDDHDQAFQSYENVNRFVILESSEFGLDVDTNISQIRGAIGAGPFDVSGRPLRIQLDVGHFAAVTPIETVPSTGNARQWGTETDLSFIWSYNQSLALSLKGGWLADSELLKRLGGESHALTIVFGADLRF